MRTKERGITLIALVITVIVLLILAGAAVSIGLNESDVFSKANTAKEDWNAKVEQEETSIRTALSYIGTKIPEGLEVGDTVNWTPSGHYTWDANYFCDSARESFFITKELYSGDEVPNDAINEWAYSNAPSNNIDMTISSWKVLKIDRDNFTVVLVPTAPTEAHVVLADVQSYNNGVKLLNDACSSLYGNYFGVKARSINLTDKINLIDPTKKEQILEERYNTSDIKYGETNTTPYTTNKSYPTLFEEEQPESITPSTGYSGRILGGEDSRDNFIKRENRVKTAETSINPIRTALAFTYDNMIDGLGEYASLIMPGFIKDSFTPGYWLATRQVTLETEKCSFMVRYVSGYGTRGALSSLYSDKTIGGGGNDKSIFPIVELTSGTIKEGTGGTYIYEPNNM